MGNLRGDGNKRTAVSRAGFVWRNIRKRIRRTVIKSAAMTLTALVLLIALSQFKLLELSYAELFDSVEIVASFTGGLPLSDAARIDSSSFTSDSYYYIGGQTAELNAGDAVEFCITNNIARCTGEEVSIEYAEGFNAEAAEKLGAYLIVSSSYMDMRGLHNGDTVYFSPGGYLNNVRGLFLGKHRDAHPNSPESDEEIISMYEASIIEYIRDTSRIYQIIGVFATQSGKHDGTVFSAGYDDPAWYAAQTELDTAEFTLADNARADEFRAYCERLIGRGAGGSVDFVMDTSRLEGPESSLRLIITLYPGALIVALLIGGFLCCLMILQSKKDAALMRTLGLPKRMVCAVLSVEQIFLSAAGLIIGAAGLLVCNRRDTDIVSAQIILIAALYTACVAASGIVCSVLAVRRSPLELLQAKE